MPRLKFDEDELDDSLDDLEYDDTQIQRYDGEQPPKGTYLRGYVKSLWMTETKAGDRMLKVLFIADGNEGKEEQYEGLPVWENLALTAGAKFKWGPFFSHFGLTIRLLKTKTIVAAEDDNIGAPITKIGTVFAPGEDSESARCAIITSREKYNDDWQTHVAEWLDDEEPIDEDEDEDEEDEEVDEDEDEEQEEDEDEEEPEEPPAKPARPTAKKAAAASTPKNSARPRAAAPASAKSPAAKNGTKSTSGAGGRTSSAKAKAATPARGARRGKAAAGYDDEPPF